MLNLLFTSTAFLIGIVIGIIALITALFIGHIVFFDCVAIAIITGVICNTICFIHPALCLLIGIAVFAVLFFLQKTRFGFWPIAVLMSIVWAMIFGTIAYIVSGDDMVWFYVVFGLSFVAMIFLHIKTKKNM